MNTDLFYWKKFDHFSFFIRKSLQNKKSFFFSLFQTIRLSIDVGQLLLIWTERFVSINPIAYNLLGFSFAHAHTNINTIGAKSNALISLASKCLMIDESLTIVSVNKLDYLLRGTRANIWPQIDAIHSVPSGWLLMFKIRKFHRHPFPSQWANGSVCVCFSTRIELLSSLFVLIHIVVVGGVGVFHFSGFRTKLEQQMDIFT